jgi:hypothetical protein
VIDGDEEVGSRPAKSAGERRLAREFDDVVADEPPELSRGNPDTAATTNDFR